jgi:hypothetical protein
VYEGLWIVDKRVDHLYVLLSTIVCVFCTACYYLFKGWHVVYRLMQDAWCALDATAHAIALHIKHSMYSAQRKAEEKPRRADEKSRRAVEKKRKLAKKPGGERGDC